MANLYPLPKQHYHAPDGALAVGYQLCFFEPGTADPKTTWQDPLQVATNTNPVILDARGEADVWLTGTYDVALKTPGGATVWTVLAYSGGPISTVSTAQEGLVENGSFEANTIDNTIPDGWDITTYNPSGVFTYDTTTQSNGSKCVKFTSAGVGGGYAQTSGYIVADELATYEIAFKYKTDTANVRVVAEIFWYTAALGSLAPTTVLDDSATNPAVWTLKSYGVTPPATARYAKIRLTGCHSSVGTHGSAWFDNVELRRTVSLTTGVSGILPVANGGTNSATAAAARTALGAAASGANADITSITGLASINGAAFSGFKNAFVNGDMIFDQWFEGTSQTFGAALSYALDQWFGYSVGAAVTGSRIAGSEKSQYRYRFNGAASVTAIGFAQRIEAKETTRFNGSTITVSVDLANSLLTTVTWVAYRPTTTADTFGTIASPTVTPLATGTFTVTGTISRYNAQISLGATDASKGLEIMFYVGAQTSGTWTIGAAQLEHGATATPFEPVPFAIEKLRCQRFFYKSYPPGVQVAIAPITASSVGAIMFMAGKVGAAQQYCPTHPFPVEMRAIPAVTFVNPLVNNNLLRDYTAAVDGGAPSAAWMSANNLLLYATGNAATAVGNCLQIHVVATAYIP